MAVVGQPSHPRRPAAELPYLILGFSGLKIPRSAPPMVDEMVLRLAAGQAAIDGQIE